MNGYCILCGAKGEVNSKAKCSECSKKAKVEGSNLRVLKMILKVRVKDDNS